MTRVRPHLGAEPAIVLIAALLVARAATGQHDSPRAPLRGTVVSLTGEPIGGAAVVLHSRPFAGLEDVVAPDTVEVIADARGRFHAAVRPGRVYAVLAHWRGGISAPVAGARDGDIVRLVARGERPMPIRLRVVGFDLWRPHGAELCLIDQIGRRLPLALDERGEAPVPAGVGASCEVAILAATGTLLQSCFVPLLVVEREERLRALAKSRERARQSRPIWGLPDVCTKDIPPLEVERVVLGPPVAMPVRVTRERTGEPVRDAFVAWYPGPEDPPALTVRTDAEGQARFLLARSVDAFGRCTDSSELQLLVVGGNGLEPTQCGWLIGDRPAIGLTPIAAERIEGGSYPRLDVALRPPSQAVAGVVRLPGGAGAAGQVLLAQVAVRHTATPTIATDSQRIVRLATGADGAWSLSYVGHVRQQGDAALVLPQPSVASLAPDGVYPWSHAIVEVPLTKDRCDLGSLHFADLRLELPGGEPAHAVDVRTWGVGSSGTLATRFAPLIRSDSRGRCRIVSGPGRGSLLAIGERHWLCHELALDERLTSLTLRLQPMLRCSGTVVDEGGRPVAGARLGLGVGRIHNWARKPDLTAMDDHNKRRLLHATSGDDGRFEVQFIPVPGVGYGLRAWRDRVPPAIDASKQLWLESESVEDARLVVH